MPDSLNRSRSSKTRWPRAACAVLAVAYLSLLSAARPVRGAVVEVDIQEPQLEREALGAAVGSKTRMRNLQLEPGSPRVSLVLERFEVFAPNARVVVNHAAGQSELPSPRNAYFRGFIEGQPDSLALLTVREKGGVRGLILGPGGNWVLGAGAAAGGPAAGFAARRILDHELAQEAAGFSCGSESLPAVEELVLGAANAAYAPSSPVASGSPTAYTATVAVETDFEYYQLFGNAADAADYVGDLFAYVSSLYSAEIDTALEVGSISLWTTAADPWQETSSSCSLFEFGRYWNDNQSGESRTIAHLLSGRSFGGVAFTGVLCMGGFNTSHGGSCPGLTPDYDNYGGAYGISGSLSGSFDLQSPQVLWDVFVVAHEIGHNFRSPHSHCYGGLEGGAEPVDGCYVGECGSPGCACGESGLPSGCSGSGQGCGTVMSYCHLQSGGLSNTAWSLGGSHPYGVSPDRVPARMLGHVQQADASYPGCLTAVNTPPTAVGDSYSTVRDADLTIPSQGVLGNDEDVDGDPLIAVLLSAPANGSVALESDGAFVYSPDPGFLGLDSFDYQANDGHSDSVPATVLVDVTGCQGDPDLVLANDTVSTTESFEACGSITVGPSYLIQATGDVTLQAQSTITFTDGFVVDQGATLRALTAP